MKGIRKALLAGAVLGAGVVFAGSGIQGTKHDLSAGNTNATVRSTTVNEICVFCHTPHHANTAFTGAPLWNKEATAQTFTMYGTTVAGTSTDPAPNAPSKACLSCHDGATAINSIVNLPGPGFDGAGGGPGTINYVEMTDGVNTYPAGTPVTMGQVSAYANVGTDLTNDHPISIPYTVNDPNNPDNNPGSLRPTTWSLTGTWLVKDSDGSGGPTVGDLLRNGKVECPSCHDPHADNKGANPVHPMFLRVVGGNQNSQLCLACHAK